MAKVNRKKLSFFTWAFCILAFVFLALGLGTLGNVNGVGKSYELLAKQESQIFGVVFELKNPEKKLKDGSTETTYLRLHEVYVNMGAIYTEAGSQAVTLRLNRSTTNRGNTPAEKLTFNTGSSYQYDTRLNNLLPESLTEEELEKQKLTPAIDSDLGNWITPFSEKIQNGNYEVERYCYYRISSPEKGVLVNEIVFVGEVLTGNGGEGTGKYCVVPTSVYYATPFSDESREEAISRANALIDCQSLPSSSQSSFFRYGKEEVATAMTIAQMGLGNTFGADNVYYGDTVYNSLGTSLVAFGTVIFGNSPFGLRFFPMLASFGVLVIGFFFAKKLFGSDKAGFAFALLYALCNFSFGLGHLGTPLMIGVFFLVASLYCCYLYYANGIGNAGLKDSMPLALSGLCGAAAICVNGAMLIPVLGVVALFVLGLLKQLNERRTVLDAAIEEAETEETAEPSVSVAADTAQTEEPTGKAKVARVLSDYHRKNAVAPAAFFTSLVVGALLLSLLFLLPVYYVAVKLYDNPAAPAANIFYLTARLFAGGFAGSNVLGEGSAWSVVHYLFRGAGDPYAITAIVTNGVAALAGLAGIAFAIYRIVIICKKHEGFGMTFVSVVLPLAGLALSLIVAIFAKGAMAFTALAYVFAFLLAAGAVRHFTECEGRVQKAAKIVCIVGIVMLAIGFLLFAVFTFSLPLPASFMSRF